MSETRFKLDTVTYDDLGTLLPLPLSVAPSRATLLQHSSEQQDQQMARDGNLVGLLNELLGTTDISYLQPTSDDVDTTLNPSSALAKSLVQANPILFQYGVSEVETAVPNVATPGPSVGMAVAAHTSQPDPATNPSHRKTRREEGSVPAERKRVRRTAKQEVYVANGLDTGPAAEKLEAYLKASLSAAARVAAANGEEEEASDEEEGRDGNRPTHRFHLDALESLHQELLTAKGQGYLHVVPSQQLHALLVVLGRTAKSGCNRVLDEDAELSSRPVAAVITALEAMLCELVLLSSPNLPPALYLEEVLGCALDLTTHHMQYNVLALHDVRFKQMYRRGADEEDADEPVKGSKTPRGKGARTPAAGRKATRWPAVMLGKLEQALSLLSEVLGLVRLGLTGLTPLVRMSEQVLTVDSLSTLHYRALGLAVSMFKYYPEHRNTVVDELVQGVAAHLITGKHVNRHYPLQSGDPKARIQMVTALVMQLVQVAAELPSVDAHGKAASDCAKASLFWADYFWRAALSRLTQARTSKAGDSAELKIWVEALVADLLDALPLPEWPGAAVLLKRLSVLLLKGDLGLNSADSAMRLTSVDLMGMLTHRLCVLAKEAEAPEAARCVAALVEAARGSEAEPSNAVAQKEKAVQQLLLEHLATSPVGDSSLDGGGGGIGAAAAPTSVSGSARQLIACTMLEAHVKPAGEQQQQQQKQPPVVDEKAAKEAIVTYRQIYERKRSCFGTSTSDLPEVSRDAAVALGRWLVACSTLGRGRTTLLGRLADVGGGGRTRQDTHAAPVRAKAMKWLGSAIEADVRVLSLDNVQKGIEGALGDDSVLVREAAVDLIGKHISRSADLAVQYYDILVRASEDVGVTVRKRAIRLLWECCVRCPGFVYRGDALQRIVARATDPEETMRALVTKICSQIWFLPHIQLEDDGTSVARSPRERAAELGEVVMAVYVRSAASLSVPFHPGMPVVATVREIVGEEGKPGCEEVRKGAREVADALLARALELQAEQDQEVEPGPSGRPAGAPAAAVSDELFRCLLALHVLCVADVKLLYRPSDPQRVVRCLSPYIKELPDTRAPKDPGSAANERRKAELLLVLLAILDGYMAVLRHLEDDQADGIARDLCTIHIKVSQMTAVSVACQCLCTLAALKPKHKETVRERAVFFYNFLEANQGASDANKVWWFQRFLYIIGMLCRYGGDILDEAPEGSKQPNCKAVLDLVLRFYNWNDDGTDLQRQRQALRVKEMALQAMGNIFISRPHLAVDVPQVRDVLSRAVDVTAPASIKIRCLTSLSELLRAEEETLFSRQKADVQEAAAAQQASTLPGVERRAPPTRNGEGDTGSVTNALVQMLWDKVLALATDTSPAAPQPAASASGGQTPPPTPNGTTGAAPGPAVRRRALDLIEVAIRSGVVVSFTAMPALCALATDPERDTARRALAQLRALVADRKGDSVYVGGQARKGVEEAYAFHRKLAAAERPAQAGEEQPRQALSPDQYRSLLDGLLEVWTLVFQPDPALKSKFITALLTPLDDGCCFAGGAAAKSDCDLLAFLTYVIAELPYKKMDELLTVLSRINDILSRRAEDVRTRFAALRPDSKGEAAASNGAGPSTSAAPAPPASPLPGHTSVAGAPVASLAAAVKASLTVSLLLLLKQYLRISYDLTTDRVATYDSSKRKVEEKQHAVHNGKLRFNAAKLRLDMAARMGSQPLNGGLAVGDPGVEEVYKVLKALMKNDVVDYRHAAAAAAMEDPEAADQPAAGEDGDVAINMQEMMGAQNGDAAAKKPPLATRGRGRGGRGRGGRGGGASAPEAASTGRGRGRAPSSGSARGRGSSVAKRGRKRKARESDSEEEEETGGDDGGDSEEEPEKYRPRTKRKLEKAL